MVYCFQTNERIQHMRKNIIVCDFCEEVLLCDTDAIVIGTDTCPELWHFCIKHANQFLRVCKTLNLSIKSIDGFKPWGMVRLSECELPTLQAKISEDIGKLIHSYSE